MSSIGGAGLTKLTEIEDNTDGLESGLLSIQEGTDNIPGTPATEETLQRIASEYSLRVVEVGAVTYIGKAAAGASTASAIWQVKKIDTTSGTVITWADGNTNFDNVWNNYLTLNYS